MIEGGIWDIMMNLIFLSKMEKEKNKEIKLCKNCLKPKDKHYFDVEGFLRWCYKSCGVEEFEEELEEEKNETRKK